MKGQILLLLISLWSTSKSEKSCNCGKFSKAKDRTLQNTRIYNGRDADHKDYPWQILLKIVATNKILKTCGGSLISRKHILTAAHCFFDAETKLWVSNDMIRCVKLIFNVI